MMTTFSLRTVAPAFLLAASVFGQAQKSTNDPYPDPIPANEGVIAVQFKEFATLPDGPNTQSPWARIMLLIDEPGTKRMFVNDMNGPLYSVSYDGKTVTKYADINAPEWGVNVQTQGNERGFQSFAFHPQFSRKGAPGYGKFYTLLDTANMNSPADFKPSGAGHTHDSVLLEWTAKDAAAKTYDGGAPRELIRVEQPFANHNCGHITFNPLAKPNSADFGLLYMGFADGGSGGDPYKHAQNLGSFFGKIHRIDPLGSNSANKKYGISPSNPFVKTPGALGEIYASGVRNPQRLFWDSKNGNMYMSDIGQNIVEEISPVTAGSNLGWNDWEGSFRYISREGVNPENPRGDPKVTFPVAEWGQLDPLLQPSSAAIGGLVYRQNSIKQLSNTIIFGDNPSGEIFYVSADNPPKGGQSAIRRILFNDGGSNKTLLQLIRAKNDSQGKPPATRADLRFGYGPNGQILVLNKRDNVIRLLVPDSKK